MVILRRGDESCGLSFRGVFLYFLYFILFFGRYSADAWLWLVGSLLRCPVLL